MCVTHSENLHITCGVCMCVCVCVCVYIWDGMGMEGIEGVVQLLQLSHGTECAMNIIIGSATHVVVLMPTLYFLVHCLFVCVCVCV